MTRYLHVANGTSTTTSIQEAGLPGAVSIWADPLHEGPVPAGATDDQLLEIRAEHLAGGQRAEDVKRELTQWRAAIDQHGEYDELVLWFEHDLFDQLNLIQVLDRLGPRWPRPVTLICIGSYPGRPRFKGLGELMPGELAPLFDIREAVTSAQVALAARAWHAFRSPTPIALEALLHTDTAALPFLAAALRRHLEELPWASDGLSRTERRLMELAAAGPIDLEAAFPRMHELETAFDLDDLSLLHVARALGEVPPALLTISRDARSADRPLDTEIALTAAGRDVLEGRADRVRRGGVQRWLGGAQLSGRGPLWRWDAPAARVIFA